MLYTIPMLELLQKRHIPFSNLKNGIGRFGYKKASKNKDLLMQNIFLESTDFKLSDDVFGIILLPLDHIIWIFAFYSK